MQKECEDTSRQLQLSQATLEDLKVRQGHNEGRVGLFLRTYVIKLGAGGRCAAGPGVGSGGGDSGLVGEVPTPCVVD